MPQRRKKCRALACPRYIEDDELFCSVHLNQLTPAVLAPVAANREPTGADVAGARRVITGTAQAVAFLAKKEGRASDLAEAQRAGETVPGQGTRSTVTANRSGLPSYKTELLRGVAED